ncbi:MAG: inositol monophosphatase [Clostridia bacterium]|nr:inositol monophosphatase [Clostridia bacterium]
MQNVIDLMRAASRLMKECNRAEVSVKGRSNFVTETDVAVQESIKKGLTALYPDYGFMSEEQENAPDYQKPLWILDPIDGTANFITHYHQSAISLALFSKGEVVFGAVYNPFTEEFFSAEKGKGAFCNGVPIRSDNEVEFQNAIIDLGTMPYYKDRAKEVGRMTEELILRAGDMRRIGSAALAMVYAAAGRTAAMLEGILQPWDFAAGMLIAKEAGACVSDWEGAPLDPRKPSSVLVAGKKVKDELLKLIREVQNELD